jgi:O-antigen ligase
MKFWQQLSRYYPAVRLLAFGGILFSLLFSKFLLSVGMIGLVLMALLHPDVKSHLKCWWSEPFNRIWLLLPIAFLLSGLISADLDSFTFVWRKKSPFLFLPLAFTAIKGFKRKEFFYLLLGFVALICGGAIYSLTQYALHFESINTGYAYGHVMPTPTDHIRFSLLVVMGIICGVELFKFYKNTGYKKLSILSLSLSIFLTLFLHLLAVRSGLLAFYVIVVYSLVDLIIRQKRYKQALVGILSFSVLCVGAYQLLPSLKTKIGYMRYDLENLKTGDASKNSDGGRFLSMQVGWQMIKANPLLGVGAGDLEKEMKSYYAEHYPLVPEVKRFIPHNEFIYTWLAAGIIGFIALVYLCLQLWRMTPKHLHWLFRSSLLLNFLALMIEPSLEMQVGAAIFVFFPLFFFYQPQTD